MMQEERLRALRLTTHFCAFSQGRQKRQHGGSDIRLSSCLHTLMYVFLDTGLGAHVCYCMYVLVHIYVVAHHGADTHVSLDSAVPVCTCVTENHSAGALILWT